MDLARSISGPGWFAGKKAVIFGLGRSGAAAAVRLAAAGSRVVVTDIKTAAQLEPLVFQIKKNISAEALDLELGGHPETVLEGADLIVLSPGVPASLPILEKARKKKIPLIGELELATLFFPGAPILAVTGTNGKTTTADLLGKIINDSGKKTLVGGNIGTPLISVTESGWAALVLEVSSYQLELATFFRPKIGLILNLTPDHLGRHGDLKGYGQAKAKLWQRQTGQDFLVYNADDQLVVDLMRSARSRPIPFSVKKQVAGGICCDGRDFYSTLDGRPARLFEAGLLNLIGRHNQANVAAAAAAALVFGVSLGSLKKTLAGYRAPEHRIEPAAVKNGVIFINDSKATNPEAVLVALDALPYPPAILKRLGWEAESGPGIVLILGGRDKNTPLDELAAKVREKVRQVVLLGEAAGRFAQALEQAGYKDFIKADSFEAAVKKAYFLARPGETVLLAPACASFDMFSDFEERGRAFKEVVAGL